ncbi:hypothetical protein GGH92_005081, partial [Coemansia sp. RSA 2673]
PPKDLEGENGEEGTVPSFPEWEEERRRRRQSQLQDEDVLQPMSAGTEHGTHDDESLLYFAHTQGNGRKRKTTSGIESARKRQWKRATSTNFVPLLPSTPLSAERAQELESPSRQPPRNSRAKSTGNITSRSMLDRDDTASDHGGGTPTRTAGRGRVGRPPKSRMSLPGDDQGEFVTSPGGRRGSTMRRGRVLNWVNILQAGVEGKDAGNVAPDSHLRPVLPCLSTVQGLQRLLEAVPDLSAAFNAELLGIDEDESMPSLDSIPANWLRQRIEALFIWPLMLGTLDIQSNRK